MLSRSTLLLVLYAAAGAAAQTCYSLTGGVLDHSFAPCNPDAKHSGCCATNRTTGGDICLDSGLCMSTTTEHMGTIWQPGCTDSTGKATECPQVCPGMNNKFDGHDPVPAWNIQTCDFGTYCCRAINDNSSCCNNSTAPTFKSSTLGSWDFKAAAIAAVGSSDVSSDDSSTISTPATSSSTAAPSPEETQATLITNADVCESEKQKTVIVGGALGGILGAVIVGLLGVIFWMAKREQRQRRLKEHYEEQFAQTWAYRKHIAASTASVKDDRLDRIDSHDEIVDKSSSS
ncbi:hypothetical protein G6514_000672 [Epicoccum nigrum]|nr:hypothetical protein G6514_000672 [Epicoccum nigrum]